MKRTELTKKTARNKGLAALGAAVTTGLFCYLSFFFLIVGLPITIAFTYQWLRYRAEWGLRF